jgi:CRP/FNR family transcriptional regulator, cyclic AMP receptor protein
MGLAENLRGSTVQTSLHSTWSNLPSELSAQLQKNTVSRRLKAGETLFEIGDEGDGCYRLDKGALKVSLRSADAKECTVAILGAGSIVGDLSMLDGKPRSASVIALTACDLSFFSRKTFEKLTERHPELFRDLMLILADRLRDSDNYIAAQVFLPMKGRVARALLELAECIGEAAASEKVLLPREITQLELAAWAGVARENVNRIMGEWQRDGVVVKTNRQYEIDKSRLRQQAAELICNPE